MLNKKYFWCTDIHLNYLSERKCLEFLIFLAQKKCDGIFITGDISNSKYISKHLNLIQKITNIPIYFILGNHDIYYSTFNNVEQDILHLVKNNNNLHYLSTEKFISLSNDVAVIGHDGWPDAELLKIKLPLVFIVDWLFIKDFRRVKNNKERIILMKKKATNAAQILSKNLCAALQNHSTVYLLTHWAPWAPMSNDLVSRFWQPYHSSKIIADSIINIMKNYQDKKLIILAGHEHTHRSMNICNNVKLIVGGANLMKPEIQNFNILV